jgi:radical SAM/Cys-rich protein
MSTEIDPKDLKFDFMSFMKEASMNAFDKKLKEHGLFPLKAKEMSAITVIMSHKCNLRCRHCYIEASPKKSEDMPISTLNKILHIVSKHDGISTINISGGSAELSPHFKYFAKTLARIGKTVMVASNLVVHFEPGMEDLPEFLAENKIVVNGSLPHYYEEGFEKVRGKGTYKKAIAAVKKLNALGYGKEGTGLALNFLYSPVDAKICPDMSTLETVFKEKLQEMHDIEFNNLFTINNMPIGRFRKTLSDEQFNDYMKELEDNFNPDSVENMMCRTSVSYDFDGKKAYDCDFWRILGMPVKSDHSSVDEFDYEALSKRDIVTHPLCFMCTAGSGCACSDLLT